MKKQYIKLIGTALVCIVALMSCEKEENLQPEGQWTLSAPEIILPTNDQSINLDQTTPGETITFNWEASVSSAGFAVTYDVLIAEGGTTDFSNPLLSLQSSNNGRETSLSITYEAIDQALAFAGTPANTQANIAFAVRATSLSKSTLSTGNFNVLRFENETLPSRLYISGTATENSDDLAEAIALRRLNDSNGLQSNIYEVYTSLVAGETYNFFSERSLPALQFGGSDGNLELFGDAIVAENSGVYRIHVDLSNNSYNLLPIDFWSMVGTPILGGWGGDEPLEYQGNGVWRASINLLETGGFAFRANGDWAFLLKRVTGSANTLIMESDAQNQGLTFEDIPSNQIGLYFVTLDLSADNYTYTFEEDNTVVEPITTPDNLYLFENGTMIEEFSKSDNVFSTDRFIPMQASSTYTLNSSMDGSGTSYSVNGALADTVTPDGDSVSDAMTLVENSNTFTLVADRALRLSIDFSVPELRWNYYNFKLFHWAVWDQRVENPMTYSHPNTYTITVNLTAGFDSKFISPWDFDLGSDNPTSLSGNLINGGGSNLLNINEDGTYQVTMILEDDYQSGSYEFNQ